jgi:hypothetical protein
VWREVLFWYWVVGMVLLGAAQMDRSIEAALQMSESCGQRIEPVSSMTSPRLSRLAEEIADRPSEHPRARSAWFHGHQVYGASFGLHALHKRKSEAARGTEKTKPSVFRREIRYLNLNAWALTSPRDRVLR